MKNNKEGNKLTIEILKNRGFIKEISRERDGDEIKWWIKGSISIHEDSWWLKELDEDGEILEVPISSYEENEIPPDITFAFATYIKSDGGFKSGYIIETDNQLDNLYYSLTSKNNPSENHYEIAYPKANKFMNNADDKLKVIIDKLNDDEWGTLRDRFADFYVNLKNEK